jgi:SAM-dependent methyltransferase
MHRSLLDLLVDPVARTPLRLQSGAGDSSGDVQEGKLRGADGRAYPVTGGIPRFVLTEDRGQRQTEGTFGYKWRQQHSYDNPGLKSFYGPWFLKRYGFGSVAEAREYLAGRKRILDAGCGAGYSASIWLGAGWPGEGKVQWVGADISVAIDVARQRLGHVKGAHFVQADVLQLPFREHSFDTIFSEGVLHHTPSTERALNAVARLLAPGGEFMFYVYRKKGPIREFADDCVREVVSKMTPEEGWEALRPLTKLGQALAGLKAEVDVPEDIPYLGIRAGKYDVQRLVYWHFLKLFWNDACSFEENHHINFDWYHPHYAHRQTEEDVRRWCEEAGLTITHLDAQESGFTVRAVRG